MPKVHFVNEHRSVDVTAGRKLSDIAKELGIEVCRMTLAGTAIGDHTVWVRGQPGSVSPPTLWERLMGCKGSRRLANRTKVNGDVSVWTQQGIGSRVGGQRDLLPNPQPLTDESAPRHVRDAAGTAHCPYGHPREVGKGTRDPAPYVPPVKKGAAAKKPAAKAAAGKKAPAKAAEKASAAKPADKPAAKPADKPADKPAAKPADKPAGKPAGKPAAKPADKSAAKPVEKSADKPAVKPAEGKAD